VFQREIATDLALAPLAGYIATKVMEPVSVKLYELESEADRQHEDAVRPGPPYQVAAQKTASLLGLELTHAQLAKLSLVFHYGLAISYAPVYSTLRRRTALSPAAAGLVTGAAMSLIADEFVTPALGFSAPNRAYPLATHVRGFVAHLVFGLGLAGVFEAAWTLLGRRPLDRARFNDKADVNV